MGWEFSVLDAIQTIHTPVLDSFFRAITALGDHGLFFIVLALLLCCFKKTRTCGICMLAGMAVGALIANVTLKPLVARARPCWINDTVRLLVENPGDYSFPSGHSQVSFVSATVIYNHNKKWGIAAYVLAILIAFSRLYLYVHFPTDVLAGALIGIAAGAAVSRIIKEKWKERA